MKTKVTRWIPDTTCNGLQPGWFLIGEQEIWYPQRICGRKRSWLATLQDSVCSRCSSAFYRRGFRVNYDHHPDAL